MALTRPVLRYHGGKWKLAPWIISFFPEHRVYVEPFGGGASVLMRKKRAYAEVYNDLDGEVVSLFRILRDPKGSVELRRLLELTPFAREEFKAAYAVSSDPIEQARRTLVRAFMGFGSASFNDSHATGFRHNSNRSGTTPAHDWVNWPKHVQAFTERLAGVVIECEPAAKVIQDFDGQGNGSTLFYVDPPYPHGTRGNKQSGVRQCYRHEMTDEQHRELAAVLHSVKGMVILSGYPCEMYDNDLYSTWKRFERNSLADGARKRTEVLWLNAAAERNLSQQRLELQEVSRD